MYQGPNQKLEKTETDRVIVEKRLELNSETVIASGAISVETPLTMIQTDTAAAAIACTLANGYNGQMKIIVFYGDDGDAVVTPANFFNGTTITLDDEGDMWMGVFWAGNWYSVGTPTATVG